ncbi:transposase IS66 [Methylocaldum marinum]|uniref:Transposase IS66 n=1 Tax=Methylocaldum marinum TaxID=1432792 RepID=A0A250KSC3_9GAMM|nr:transposase IS66 [Methylocaldum marinum]
MGRRNWLFADTVGGAKASANLYSLIETCNANCIEPYSYLVDLFRKLPLAKTADDFEALLPWHLAKATACPLSNRLQPRLTRPNDVVKRALTSHAAA